MAFNLPFLSNNVNGFRSSKKRVKMFEYFKGQIVNNGISTRNAFFRGHF